MYFDEERYDIFEFQDKVYIPTPCEATLLKALVTSPAGMRKVEDICELANVSLDTYYRAMKKEDFKKAYYSVLMDSLVVKADIVIESVFKFATTEKANHSDRKLMLEILGLYEKKSKVDITKKSVNVSVKQASTQDLKQMLKELVKSDPKLLEDLTNGE